MYVSIMMTALMRMRRNTPPIRRYASIHPINRKMEWKCKKDKMAWLHDDICPTVTANEYRSVGNVIWEIYEEVQDV